jgi:hypothetical protein
MRALGILCTVTLGLCGCMTTRDSERSATDADLVINPYDTIADRPDVLLTAQLSGRLLFDGRCVVVQTAKGPVVPLWPEGTQVVVKDDRQVITLPEQRGSVAIGGKASLSGAAFSASDTARLPTVSASCAHTFFAVSTAR